MKTLIQIVTTIIIVCYAVIAKSQTALELIESAQKKGNNGDYQDALNEYNTAITLDSTIAIAFIGRGVANDFLGNKEAAFNDYNKTIQLNPKLAGCLF